MSGYERGGGGNYGPPTGSNNFNNGKAIVINSVVELSNFEQRGAAAGRGSSGHAGSQLKLNVDNNLAPPSLISPTSMEYNDG